MSGEGRFAAWRGRLPVLVVVVGCVAGLVAALTGAANPVSAVQFLLPGHWVYNASLQSVFHVDGATANVDARAGVPGGDGDQVVQGEVSGYVVGSSRITEFGRSSLTVAGTSTPPSQEVPVGVETAGGPYLVYRNAGKVVRLTESSVVLSLGGPIGDPVATTDGTLWLPRTGAGLLCRLDAGAGQVSCPVAVPKGHGGGLAVVDDRPVFVDTTTDLLHSVSPDGLGVGRPLGVDAADGSRFASTDVDGKVAILHGSSLHLVDSRSDAAPVTVELPDGDYVGPVSTGRVVAVVDRTSDTLTTYDSSGSRKQTAAVPAEDGDPRLTRGEDDRIYVDGTEGEHVLVVDKDGAVDEVPIDGDSPSPAPPVTPVWPPPASPPPPVSGPPPVAPVSPPVTVPPSPPGAPTNVAATAGNATATVSWGPAPNNRAALTGYTVTWPGGQTAIAPGTHTATVTGLANGTAYVFTVAAVNSVGTGPGASSNPVTPVAPAAPAAAPGGLQVTRTGGALDVAWTAPAMGDGSFVHYLVSVTGQPDQAVTAPQVSYPNVPQEQDVTVTVRAITQVGGAQLTGAPATRTAPGVPLPTQTLTVARGRDSSSDACVPPDCAWLLVTMTGFAPNTSYTVTAEASEWGDFSEPSHVQTDETGAIMFEDIRFDGGGQTVWVWVDTPTGRIESNHYNWAPE